MDDWNQRREDEKSLERAKSDGIEASGALMRRLAMGELEQELLGEDESDDNSKDIEESCSGTEAALGRSEVHKNTRTSVTGFGLREEADKKRAHDVMMEQRRQEAEMAREEGQLAAEREREKFMLKLLEMAMARGKETNRKNSMNSPRFIADLGNSLPMVEAN
ncbi:unnamed protein product [Phytophthora lilii]|uniref:Unnamed protein product n=1 Tax=Phytophthora lilii TaxID=2077276 RepID=A0A9W6TT77_9STRA|nr:unnamed protein product [Phytophthora lilii]